MMYWLKNLIGSLCCVAIIAGCTAPMRVQYGDPTWTETTTIDFGSTDLQDIANKMVGSLLTFPPIVQVTRERRPVIFVERIKNKTLEHIDTESITDTIRTKIVHSGMFRFIDMTKVDAVMKQLGYQSESGLVDPAKSASFGRQIGAEYMLYGNLSSIVKRTGGVKDVYYKFTLNLMHLQTGILEWADEKEIRKIRSRAKFGR
ncbi:MAG: penicillin-binding protein activator LpoB [Candidatus Brocadiales bacterium]